MNRKPEDRIERIVSDLLNGRRLKLRGGDAEEKAAITTAARLAGARQGPQRMHPAFRNRLAQALRRAPGEGWVTRRAALVAGLGLVAGATGGAILGRSLGVETVAAGGEPIQPIGGRWIDVASIDDLAEGRGHHIVAGGVSALVFRKGDSLTAVSSICTHLPCELWWNDSDANLVCKCHPVTFKADGRPSEGYSLPALNKVLVRMTATGRVEVLGTE